MNRLSIWICSMSPSLSLTSLAGRSRPAGSLVRIGAARSAGVVLLAGTALLVGMAPQLAGAQPGAPAPLVQTAPPASAASVAPPSRLPPEADAAVLPSPPPEQIQADSELPALRPLDRLIARMDPNHVDGVGLAYIAGQAAALFNVLAAQAEQDAASWQGEDAGHGVTDADETARAGEAHHASPDSRASGAPQSSGSPRSSAAAQSSATPQSRDTTHASGGTPASESEQRREDSAAAKARVLGKHFGACAADFELVARWLTLRHQTQDLKQRDAQQAELESLYRREAEKHRAAGLGQFPPSMRRDYDAAMDIHPAVKTLADHWRRELAERAGAEAPSGKRN